MEISTHQSGAATVMDVAGDITLYNSQQVRSALLAAVRDAKGAQVILDLHGVRYIDSSGVASLIEGLKASRETGTRLTLVGLSLMVREVLELTRVLKLFDVLDDEEQAQARGT